MFATGLLKYSRAPLKDIFGAQLRSKGSLVDKKITPLQDTFGPTNQSVQTALQVGPTNESAQTALQIGRDLQIYSETYNQVPLPARDQGLNVNG